MWQQCFGEYAYPNFYRYSISVATILPFITYETYEDGTALSDRRHHVEAAFFLVRLKIWSPEYWVALTLHHYSGSYGVVLWGFMMGIYTVVLYWL